MPFPEIKYCIICDGVKPAARGKIDISGFLGMSPEAFIDVDFPPGWLELSFLMQGGAGDGRGYGISFKIVDHADKPLHTEPVDGFVARPEPKIYVVLEAARVQYPGPGKYRLQLIVDGVVHYEASFELFKSDQTK